MQESGRTVITGSHAGELVPMKFDAEGRGELYIADSLDVWGTVKVMGLAELAARLGSSLLYDRRGDILYQDCFESSTPKYQVAGTGTIQRSNTYALYGDFSLKLTSGAFIMNSVAANYFHTDYHDDQKIGVQTSMASPDLAVGSTSFYIAVSYVSSVTNTLRYARLGFIPAAGGNVNVVYMNNMFADITIDTVALPQNEFGTIKFVVDTATSKYVRALVLGKEYDLSTYDITNFGIPATKHLIVQFAVMTLAMAAKTVYIDNYVLTENEPEN